MANSKTSSGADPIRRKMRPKTYPNVPKEPPATGTRKPAGRWWRRSFPGMRCGGIVWSNLGSSASDIWDTRVLVVGLVLFRSRWPHKKKKSAKKIQRCNGSPHSPARSASSTLRSPPAASRILWKSGITFWLCSELSVVHKILKSSVPFFPESGVSTNVVVHCAPNQLVQLFCESSRRVGTFLESIVR